MINSLLTVEFFFFKQTKVVVVNLTGPKTPCFLNKNINFRGVKQYIKKIIDRTTKKTIENTYKKQRTKKLSNVIQLYFTSLTKIF